MKEESSYLLENDNHIVELSESYIYDGQVYEIKYDFNENTEEYLCKYPDLEDKVRAIYNSPKDLYFLSFMDEPSSTYIFDSQIELDRFSAVETPKRIELYLQSIEEATITTRGNDNCWLTFWKDCGNQNIELCAPDHVDNYEEKYYNFSTICSAKWEQSDLGNVPMPQIPGGNWDQAISRWAANPVHFPLPFFSGTTLGVVFFRGINFDGSHHCRNEQWNITSNFVSTCLNKVRWGFLCDDMNDSISSWRVVYCTTLPCDGGCYSLL